MRVPRMTGLPIMTFGLISIRFVACMTSEFYSYQRGISLAPVAEDILREPGEGRPLALPCWRRGVTLSIFYLPADDTSSAAETGPITKVSVCQATKVRISRVAAKPVLRPCFLATSSTLACCSLLRSGATWR